jgi:biopolymer transport protein ExbD
MDPRPRHETIVALIDIMFFLLVFFMLVGRMDANSPFELLPPISTNGATLPAGGTTIAVSRDGRLALDGAAIDQRAILGRLRESMAQGDEPLFIRINAHADAPLRHVLQLVTTLESLGEGQIVLVVTPSRR